MTGSTAYKPNRTPRRQALCLLGASLGLALLSGCHMDMWIQPKYNPYTPSDLYVDGQSMRPLPLHTMDRTHYWTDQGRYTGYVGRKMVETIPIKIGREDILRGQERFNIYCSPCHGALGNGQGMIAMRGLALRRQPASYHTDKLRKMPVGHFYDVITNGFGVMYSYASRVEPDDRWRIAAYIRVLQRSQNARLSDLPPDKQGSFTPPPAASSSAPASSTPPPASGATSPAPTMPSPAQGAAPNTTGQGGSR